MSKQIHPQDASPRAQRAAVERARTVSTLLDEAIPVPGTDYRIGLDPILGILPGAGDLVSSAISLYLVLEGINVGVPRSTLVRMLANIAVDAIIGSIPVIGVLFDAVWKANKRNLALLEAHVDGEASETVR